MVISFLCFLESSAARRILTIIWFSLLWGVYIFALVFWNVTVICLNLGPLKLSCWTLNRPFQSEDAGHPFDLGNFILMFESFPAFFFSFFFSPRHEACGILVPWPVIEPRLQQWELGVLTTGSPGNFQFSCFLLPVFFPSGNSIT